MQFEPRRPLREAINLVPLINIVFLLLIFFMLSSTLVKPDAFDVTLPESDQERAPPTEPIVILISGDGRVALNNQPIGLASLETALAAARAERQDATLLIKADAEATTADATAVLRQARAAGFKRVGLATESQ